MGRLSHSVTLEAFVSRRLAETADKEGVTVSAVVERALKRELVIVGLGLATFTLLVSLVQVISWSGSLTS